ncbi:hypothetical protein JHK85_045785 [Glycine max]|nr:hypothetical protein JHK85_045785 [Glycine max]
MDIMLHLHQDHSTGVHSSLENITTQLENIETRFIHSNKGSYMRSIRLRVCISKEEYLKSKQKAEEKPKCPRLTLGVWVPRVNILVELQGIALKLDKYDSHTSSFQGVVIKSPKKKSSVKMEKSRKERRGLEYEVAASFRDRML